MSAKQTKDELPIDGEDVAAGLVAGAMLVGGFLLTRGLFRAVFKSTKGSQQEAAPTVPERTSSYSYSSDKYYDARPQVPCYCCLGTPTEKDNGLCSACEGGGSDGND